ncbi:MAG TPA: RDD family protein [Bryobacteraceae bacterium]|nr:RDD family protein [Bryobacteraceae bacterium]
MRLSRPQLVEVPSAPLQTGIRPTVQPSLFGPMAVAAKASPAPQKRDPAPRRKSEPAFVQAALDFSSTTDGARTLPTSVEANLYCDAPVATSSQRIMATSIDIAVPAAGFALFVISARLLAPDLPLGGEAQTYLIGVAVLLGLFYRVVCCLGNMDTPGMQWTGLRLLDFDGRRPKRRARLFRLGGALVSLFPVGIGFVWSIFEEERLTWSDLISSTFPSPRND